MLSQEQWKSVFKSFHGGFLHNANQSNEFSETFNRVISKCQILPSDDDVTKIFKLYIQYGEMKKLVESKVIPSQYNISDILFFRQANDIEITLIAKGIYANSGSNYHKFLKEQVNVILRDGKINIRDEYIRWRRSLGLSENAIAESLEKIQFE